MKAENTQRHDVAEPEYSYTYADCADKLVNTLFRDARFASYWRHSEERILEQIEHRVKTYCPTHAHGTLLDAGCGDGRLIRRFQTLFGAVLALDSDRTRLQAARELCIELKILHKTKLMCRPVQELADIPVDTIICSHLLQHVSYDFLETILQVFHRVLRPRGLLFITTSHSRRNTNYFIETRYTKNGVRSTEISKNAFDLLCRRPEEQALPTHLFSLKYLADTLASHGFRIHESQVFHLSSVNYKIDSSLAREILINATRILKPRFGCDQYLFAERL